MEITKEYIFRSFIHGLSAEEKAALDAWIGESEANARIYREALIEYEYLLVNADMDSLRGTRRPAAKSWGIAARIAGGIAAAVAIFFVATWVADYRIEKNFASNLMSMTALPGQIMSMTLPDGTSVQLNAGTTMYYPAQFIGKKRVVQLEGEAYFDVEHDSNHPFVVKTYASDIEVLGTEFNVDADEDNGVFSVALAEGVVKVSPVSDPDNAIIMRPDQKVYLENGRLEIENVRVKDEIRWKDGIVDIEGLDFAALMDKLEMAFGVEIVIDRETLPEIGFTDGRLRVSDGIEYALEVLRNGSDFTWSKDFRTGTIYIR